MFLSVRSNVFSGVTYATKKENLKPKETMNTLETVCCLVHITLPIDHSLQQADEKTVMPLVKLVARLLNRQYTINPVNKWKCHNKWQLLCWHQKPDKSDTCQRWPTGKNFNKSLKKLYSKQIMFFANIGTINICAWISLFLCSFLYFTLLFLEHEPIFFILVLL